MMQASKEKIKEIDRLKKRSDFLYVQNNGRKWVSKSLILQVATNNRTNKRFGLTVSKRVSKSAVIRNRIKRRLKAAAYEILPACAADGMDYVLIGRAGTEEKPFSAICKDFIWCLDRLDVSNKPAKDKRLKKIASSHNRSQSDKKASAQDDK